MDPELYNFITESFKSPNGISKEICTFFSADEYTLVD